MDKTKLDFLYNCWGYTLLYRRIGIGSVGIAGETSMRNSYQRRLMFKELAEKEIEKIILGVGQARFMEKIDQIEGGGAYDKQRFA
jgi:hypothetical protein